jgi:hypothetical protein
LAWPPANSEDVAGVRHALFKMRALLLPEVLSRFARWWVAHSLRQGRLLERLISSAFRKSHELDEIASQHIWISLPQV